MAISRGDLISRSKLSENYSGWIRSEKVVDQTIGSNVVLDKIYHIAAPCFKVTISGHRTGAFNTAYLSMTVYEQNGIRSWNVAAVITRTLDITVSRDFTWSFGHNYSNGCSESNASDIHLYKVVARWDAGDSGFFGRIDCSLTLQVAGIWNVPDTSTYNHMWKRGNKIYACPCNWYEGLSDGSFIEQYRPQAYRGTSIDTINAYYCYAIKET